MDYENNVEDQRNLLEKHLDKINIVVSAILGINVNLRIRENKNYQKQIIFELIDDKNIKNKCGVMENAFANVHIETFGIWWQKNGAIFELDFRYEHIDGGSNGTKFCIIQIQNDLLKVLQK